MGREERRVQECKQVKTKYPVVHGVLDYAISLALSPYVKSVLAL